MKPNTRFFVNCYHVEKSGRGQHKEAIVDAIATNSAYESKGSILSSGGAIDENKGSPSMLAFVEMIDEDG